MFCGCASQGNNNLNLLTTAKRYKLRIDLADFNGTTAYAEYDNFIVESSTDKYRLSSIGNYSGTAGQLKLSVVTYIIYYTFTVGRVQSPPNNLRGSWVCKSTLLCRPTRLKQFDCTIFNVVRTN